MRRLRPACLALSIAIGAALAPARAPAAPPVVGAGADPQRACRDCGAPDFPVSLPRHGAMLATAGLFSYGWRYTVFDRDRQVLAISFAPSAPAGALEPEYAEYRLTRDEVAELDAAGRAAHAAAGRLPGSMATDSFWDLWLLDGDAVRRERGIGNLSGPGKPLAEAIARIGAAHAPR